MVKNLPRALLLALLVGSPVMAQQALWEEDRDTYLGPQRYHLMAYCGSGKEDNLKNKSFFASERVRGVEKEAQKTINSIDSLLSGMAAAMAIVCPSVW